MSEGLGNVPSGGPGFAKTAASESPGKSAEMPQKKFQDLCWLIEFII